MNQIDPFTGLELTELKPSPPIRPIGRVPSSASPSIEPSMTESETPSQATMEKSSFMDKVLFALTGPADSDLPADKLRARNGRRAEAGNLAASWKNPGRAHMGPVSGGGGSALESLGSIIRLFGGAGG